MKQNIHYALLNTFNTISLIESTDARNCLSLTVTYAHAEFVADAERAKGCCEACYDEELDRLYDRLIKRLAVVQEDVEQVMKNARIGLAWWFRTSHDKNN